MDCKEIVEGKSIIVVGSSDIIKGKRLGEFIDSHDVVVKFNGSLFIQKDKEYQKDYGKKDTLHFLTNPFVRELKPDLKKYPFVKHFLFKRNYPQYTDIPHTAIPRAFKEVESKMKRGFTYSGVAVVHYLTKLKPKHLFLTGMDMYINRANVYNKDWSGYVEGYIHPTMKAFEDESHKDGHLAHSRYWNAVVLKEIIETHYISCDARFLEKLDMIISHKEAYE